ncbi:unnamed protein product [Paramecium sonneborni]|uniref:ARID domain-containing protein n=1 Tax=Paramecium sonneborni TaxID=65129 RepID=A0A8S1L2V7_9CILI|nr:unnamed protein product [Paramecium sonneborni]
MDEREEEKAFIQQLQKFWEQRGVTIKIPQIGGRELEVFKLYKAVTKRGGLKVVSANKLWKEIVDQFSFPATCTSASFTLRNHYQKLLLAYEQKYFFGKEDGYIYDEEMSSNRKKTKIGFEEENQQASYAVEAEDRQHQQEYIGQPLLTLLNQNYSKADKAETLFFIKKSKIQAQASEVKRIMLAFESRIDDELTFAINNLLMYSCNYSQSFLLDQYPQLLDTITTYVEDTIKQISYLNKSYSFKTCLQTIGQQQLENLGQQQRKSMQVQTDLIKNQNVLENYNSHISVIMNDQTAEIVKPSELIYQKKYKDLIQGNYEKKAECKHLEKLRTLFVALRNLAMIRSNETCFMKQDKLLSFFYQILLSGADQELSKSVLEIFSVLSKHIHLKQSAYMDPFMQKLIEILNGESYEDIGLVTETLRNLISISDNEALIEGTIGEYIDQLARLLIYQNQELREIVLEFFCYLSDLKMATRLSIAKHPKILQRLVAILSIGQIKNNSLKQQEPRNNQDKINEKHVKLAAITLNNISQAPAAKQYLLIFEKELFLVAASDETVTPLLSQILFELSLVE